MNTKVELINVPEAEYTAITGEIKAIEQRLSQKIRIKREAFTRWMVDFLDDLDRARPLFLRIHGSSESQYWNWVFENTNYSKRYALRLLRFRDRIRDINPLPRISMGMVQILDLCPQQYLEPILTGAMTFKGLAYDQIKLMTRKEGEPSLADWVKELREEDKARAAQEDRGGLIVDRDDSGEAASHSSPAERALQREEQNERHRRRQDKKDSSAKEVSHDPAEDLLARDRHAAATAEATGLSKPYLDRLVEQFGDFRTGWDSVKAQLVNDLADGELTADDKEALRDVLLVAGELHNVLKQRL